MTESHTRRVIWTHLDSAKEHTFRTTVTIDESDPITDVDDIAHERCYEAHGDIEIIDTL